MLMALFWEYWHWVMFILFVLYFSWIYDQSIGVKGLLVTPIHYEAPVGISVMTAGMLYDNFTDYRDFISGVLELSVKGYVEMHHQENGDLYIKKTEKSYGRLRDIERFMLNDILFSEGKNIYFIPKERYEWVRKNITHKNRTRVPTARQTEIIQDFVRLKEANVTFSMSEGYIRKKPAKARRDFLLQSLVLFTMMIILGYISKEFTVTSVGAFLFCFFVPLLVFLRFGMHWVSLLFGLGPIMLFFNLLLNVEVREMLLPSIDIFTPYIIFMLAFTVAWKFYPNISVLTAKGRSIRLYLMGLKTFLSRVKQDELDRIQSEKPNHIDTLVPYMEMFGLSSYALHHQKGDEK
jgi:hypothetical protein